MRRFVPVLAAALVAAVLALPVAAQLKVGGGGVDVQGPNNSAVASPDGGTVRDMRRQGGHTLRCWQYGRLLYEVSGFRGGLNNPSAIGVPRATEGSPVTVLDLKDALCILSD